MIQCFAVVLAMMCFASVSEARTLETILRDKGVITAQEYEAAVEKKGLATYDPARGLTVQTADGNFRTSIGGYAQFLYRYTDVDDRPGANDSSDFNIRRFKVVLQGNVLSKNLGYRVQGDVSTGWRTEDAFVNYRFGAPLVVQFGQYKPPQARQELTGAGRQLFPERSLANDTFNLGRDLGVMAAGSFAERLVDYRVGVFNGNGPNTRNPDNRHMVAGRLDFHPLGPYPMDEGGWRKDKPLVTLGSSFAWKKVGPNDVGNGFNRDNDVMEVALGLHDFDMESFRATYGDDLTWLLWTANFNATWKGAVFAAEYYRLNADPAVGSDWNADGYYVQAGYQIIPTTLELAARYSAIESTDTNASAPFDVAETQVGLNYYFSGHRVKLQSDLTFVDDKIRADRDDTRLRLQATVFY